MCSTEDSTDHQYSLFILLTALCDGNTGLANANTFIRTEGGSVIAACPFTLSGRKKFLCKGECKEEDILIETKGSMAQRGRYSIKYKEGTFPVSSTALYVSITQLTKADSGRYRCGLERPFLPDSYWEFEVRVTDGEFLLRVSVCNAWITSFINIMMKLELYKHISTFNLFADSVYEHKTECVYILALLAAWLAVWL